MTILTTKTFDELFCHLDIRVQRKAAKKADLFRENPFHPSLRVEKLHPKRFNVWSFRVDIHYRIIFRFLERERVVFLFIGHHNDIYDYDLFR